MIYNLNILFILIITSCSTTNKMYDKIEYKKLFNQLVENNGNAFYVNSTHITVSFVWSYSNNEATIYKLSKGKVIDRKVVKTPNSVKMFEHFSKEDFYEVDTCIELDGDMFGFILKRNDKVEQKDLPINLNCFTKAKYKSYFLNEIVSDINTYNIKW